WQVQQPGTVAVPKSVHAERIAENFDVFDFSLTEAEMSAISALKKPDGRIVSPPFAPKWDV
ncbi:MAG: aldo/keto reductase, partial [Rhizobiales bacterium]|nr:aldo/keto reductase [Hyphomicrobiales bacterium]